MLVYYLLQILIVGLAVPLCIIKPHKYKAGAYLLVVFGYMWLLATFRHGIGFDYDIYIEIFDEIRNAESFGAMFVPVKEPVYVLLNKVIGLFTHNPIAFYGVMQLLIFAPIVWMLYRHCAPRDVWLATWLYVTLAFYYTSMNFTRQSLATSVVVMGYGFLKNKKPVPFILIVIAATLIHKTAIIMIPVYFLCHFALNLKLGGIYMGVTLIAYLSCTFVIDKVTDYIYTGYKDSIYTTAFSPIFLFVPFVLFGGCLALWPVWRKRVPEADMLLNLLLYSAIIWMFITRAFILERFSMYTYIFALIGVPSALRSLEAPDEDKLRLEQLKAEETKKKTKNKADTAAVRSLAQKISDHQKYYWSAVAALLLITWMYNEFGSNVNGFHGVFPYRSVIPWLDNPPAGEEMISGEIENALDEALEDIVIPAAQ